MKAIKELTPALVFLDVKIHDQNGFDLLKQLSEVTFSVIFTTAYEQYAIQAFKFSALDYLLKPIDSDDLVQAIKKLKEKNSKEESSKKFEALFTNLQSFHGAISKVCVPTINGFELIDVSTIIRCEGDINYTTIYVKDNQKIKVAKTLKDFEDMLSPYNFYRVHKSHLVNLSYVKKYNNGKNGYISMTDNSIIEISSLKKDDFLKKFLHM